MQDATSNQIMLNAALQYVLQGWMVFPVHGIINGRCSCGKSTCGSPGKHPISSLVPHGCRDATTDQDKIQAWWAKHPHANIAVATGRESGFFAIDVDLPEGAGSLESLEKQHGGFPVTLEQITGGGGKHLLFKVPDDCDIRNSTGRLGLKIDVRGEGGYIVLAPSQHIIGKSYAWGPGHGPQEIGIAEAPRWLIDLLQTTADPRKLAILQPPLASQNVRTTPYGRAAIEGEIRTLAETPEGQRNDALNTSAFKIGQLITAGEVSHADAENALITTGAQLGLTPNEVRATVKSGIRKGMSNPRTIQPTGNAMVTTSRSESPRPLVREIPPGGEYPIEALEQLLGDAVRAIVDIVQVPPALAAGSVLATASLATQGFADVILPIGVGHPRPLSLYIITVAESSDRKTTADSYALQGVKKYETTLAVEHREKFRIYQNAEAAYERAKEAILKKTGKSGQQSADGLAAISREITALGEEPQPPLLPALTIQEPTIEGLAKLFLLGRPSLGLFSTEGAQMITGYGMRDDRKLATAGGLSMLWDGETFKRTRVGDGNYALPGRRLTLHLMVQPEVARRLLSDPELADQGLVSRILVSAPESLAGTRKFREAGQSSLDYLNRFEEKIEGILSRPLALVEGSRNELKPRRLPLSPAAKRIWISFHDEIETEIGSGGKFEQVKAFAGKLAEHAARIAGILTLTEDFDEAEVSGKAMESACELGRFYAAEALRLLYVGLTSPELSGAQKLLDWLHKRDGELISLPDIYQRGPNSIREKARAAQLVKILVDHGWLIPVPEGTEIQGQFRREVWMIVRPGD